MNFFYSAFLGILQGLTEFLPVSSSGHLVIAQNFIPGFSQPGVLFDVFLHFGTTLAVLYFFRQKLLKINFNYLLLIIIGTLPAVFLGFVFRKQLESMFFNIKWVGIELIFTGMLNFFVDIAPKIKRKLNGPNAFWIGVAQAIAIIPGISRSGATIFAGTRLGINKQEIAEYSFLLSVPAILGANLLEISAHGLKSIDAPAFYLTGFIGAFVAGFLAIKLVFKFLEKRKFKYFGIYCLLLGLVALIA